MGQVAAIVLTVSLGTSESSRNQQREPSFAVWEGRGGLQGGCSGDFLTQEAACGWVSSLTASRLSVVSQSSRGDELLHHTLGAADPWRYSQGYAQWPSQHQRSPSLQLAELATKKEKLSLPSSSVHS